MQLDLFEPRAKPKVFRLRGGFFIAMVLVLILDTGIVMGVRAAILAALHGR